MKTTKINDNALRDAELLAVLNGKAASHAGEHKPLLNATRTGVDVIVKPRRKLTDITENV